MTRLLRETEVADLLAINIDTLRRRRRRADGSAPPHILLGNRVRYSAGDVRSWLVARRKQ